MTNKRGSASAGAQANPKSRRRIVFLFVLSQVIVFFVLIEIGARFFDPMGISYYPETARLLDQMIHEEPIGYRLPPGMIGHYHGAEVRTNALGMRDRPVAPEKETGEFRILMIGDSVMFSIGVEFEESIPFQIEQLANRGAPPGRHYRTLNMGIPSYNTEQELVQTQQLGLSLKPDAAVLVFVGNDIEGKMWVFEKRSSLFANFAQRSYATSLAYSVLQPRAKWLFDLFLPTRDTGEPKKEGRKESRFDEIAGSLTAINQALSHEGIPFLLIHRSEMSDELVGALQAVGRREGFPVRRLEVWDDPRWKTDDPLKYTTSLIDRHCNPKGCELTAIVMYEIMLETGLLD